MGFYLAIWLIVAFYGPAYHGKACGERYASNSIYRSYANW